MAWPLYIRIAFDGQGWVATGWQAGAVELAILAIMFLIVRLLYRVVRLFARGGFDED